MMNIILRLIGGLKKNDVTEKRLSGKAKIIVGLGNPGSKYDKTRHNIGRMVIDAMAEKYKAVWQPKRQIYWQAEIKIKGTPVVLCKPDTYMNNSGEAVRKIAKDFGTAPEDIIAIVDEYNFPVNKIQVKRGGSNGGHNGITSIIEELETEDFVRFRCGIGKKFAPGEMIEYVLERFPEDEADEVEAMIKRSVFALEYLCNMNFGKAASDINSGILWKTKAPKVAKRTIKKITVYAGSTNKCDEKYSKAASEIGKILADNAITVTYGGGSVGLMGHLADSILDNKGKIIGIIPKFLQDLELGHKGITFMHVTETMSARKMKLIEGAEAVVALPGGIGTFEEVLEVISLKQLGQFTAPIVFLNVDGYFNPLLEMLDKSIEEHFMLPQHRLMYVVANKAEEVMSAIENSPNWEAGAINFMKEKIG